MIRQEFQYDNQVSVLNITTWITHYALFPTRSDIIMAQKEERILFLQTFSRLVNQLKK